jgi:hypothetical protein
MKTISKHFQQAGNITLVQFETLEGEGLGFNAAAPAMDKGGLVIRVANISVLLAPCSKQEVHASCVERSRWSFDSPSFKPGPDVMDSKMRAAKTETLRMDLKSNISAGRAIPNPGFELTFEGQPVHMAGFRMD